MAKKQKVVIVDQELTPTVLANLKSKKANLLGLIILFILFGGTIFYLPEISAFLDSRFQFLPVVNPNNIVSTPEKPKEEEKEEEPQEYPYSSELVISEANFELNSFDIVDDVLTFNVANKKSISLNLDDYNYYLHLYNSNNTLLQRIKFDDLIVSANSNSDVSYKLDNANVAYFTFYEISLDEYPSYVPNQNPDKEATLTCRKDYRKINYLLLDNKLYAIEDLYEIPNSDPDYALYYADFQSKYNVYTNLAGVDSSLNVEAGFLKFSTYINLNAKDTANINEITYPKDTDAKVMYFELLSKGYKCE